MLFISSKVTYAQDYSTLQNQFDISSILPNVNFGFSLYDLDNETYVFGVKENQYFTPASNTKVYTLFSSLKHIGDSIPGIQYIVSGDSLIFWGTGDPTFLHPKLDSHKVYDFLKNTNKKLFYAHQESTEPPYRNGWSVEDYEEDFQPDIAPFPIYGNLVRFSVLENNVISSPKYFKKNIKSTRKESSKFTIRRDHYSNDFKISNSPIPENFKTSKPFIWSDSLFVSLLQDTLHKDITTLYDYDKPSKTNIVYSVPRNVLLREMMLPSDNFLAEHLTMLISSIRYNGFYTDSLRREIHREYYTDFQDSIILRDGSGLSTYNKITPRSMVELLLAIEDVVPNDDRRYLFFPTGGIDGTLKNAYTIDNGVPFIWAKTGTINSVYCQSGYIVTRAGRRYAFSFLNNNFTVPTSSIRGEIKRIMTFIRQNY